jgi:hypothetical protein
MERAIFGARCSRAPSAINGDLVGMFVLRHRMPKYEGGKNSKIKSDISEYYLLEGHPGRKISAFHAWTRNEDGDQGRRVFSHVQHASQASEGPFTSASIVRIIAVRWFLL